jgi:hypothetical protein
MSTAIADTMIEHKVAITIEICMGGFLVTTLKTTLGKDEDGNDSEFLETEKRVVLTPLGVSDFVDHHLRNAINKDSGKDWEIPNKS